MPHTGYNAGRIGWHQLMACLFGIARRYCSIIEWAGAAPTVGQSMAWVGPCESALYTLTCIATYLAANGVTYHDADNAWAWGNTHLCELHQWYLGDENPEVAPLCDMVEADLQHMSGEAVSHSCECILELATSWGVEPHLIPPLLSSGECEVYSNWQVQMADTHELYALPVAPVAASMDVDSLTVPFPVLGPQKDQGPDQTRPI